MPSVGRNFLTCAGHALTARWVLLAVMAGLLSCGKSAAPPGGSAAKANPTVQNSDGGVTTAQGPQLPAKNVAATGAELYALHCAACHGEKGDGKGLAATYVFPKPRDFRQGKFRIVSSTNLVPTEADLEGVLTRGMPGSSMPPWPKLSAGERKLLVEQVLGFFRTGLRDSYIARVKEEEDEEPEEDAIAAFVKRRGTPEAVSEIPGFDEPTGEAIARGKELYTKQSCHSCHGKEGKGDGVQAMFDDDKLPIRPRDFTVGVFKGGHDAASLYRRTALGMPGTPMPSSANLSPEQISELTHFIRSLSDEPTRQSVILNRETIVARQVPSVSLKLDDSNWEGVKPATIRTTPLWWRDDPSPMLQVSALHDGQSLAVRLVWNDLQPDRHAGKTESFRDAAAIELSSDGQEPFVGMGAKGSPLDLWLWDADRAAPADLEEVNPRIVVDVYPFNEKQVETAEFDRPGTKTTNQAEISLPAKKAGNQLARSGTHASGGSTLTGAGPGSITFRPRENQTVKAQGEWHDGRWTVVFVRPLASADGVTLTPGARVSAAFALWDGAHQDRGPQKLISIWQDLVLEAKP